MDKQQNEEIIEGSDSFEKEGRLFDLLSQCKSENRHETIDFGVEGKELI